MKFLITGGIGFIGGHLCEALIKQNHIIIVVDNISPYYDRRLKLHTLSILESLAKKQYADYGAYNNKDNKNHINNLTNSRPNGIDENNNINKNDVGQKNSCLGEQNFKFFDIDLVDGERLNTLFINEGPFDFVVHLAAQPGVRYSIDHPSITIQNNIVATVNILESISKYSSKSHFIFASSSSVYGEDSTSPFCEASSCNKPESIYAASKKSGEMIAYSYHSMYHIQMTVLRFFTVYGPRGRPDMACYKFIDAIMLGKTVEIYGDGTAKREFTYISDIIRGILSAIATTQEVTTGFRTINLGGGATYTILELLSIIEKGCEKVAKVSFLQKQLGDVDTTSADQTEALNKLNFLPKISIENGIKETILWYSQWWKNGSTHTR